MSVGDFADPELGTAARPVKSGESDDGATVTVTCRVAPSGASRFSLSASIVSGTTTLEVSGDLDANGEANGAKMTLKGAGATWASSTCELDVTVGSGMGAAAGRYWGLLTCVGATSSASATCDVFGQIRLENCQAN